MERAADNLQRPKFLKLYRLLFSRYTIFKFWSRDYHVIMTSQKFLVWSSKCTVYQPFIWGAAIGRTFFGSLVIWLLNFWRFSRLWLILEASRYIHWACRCSWWFSLGRITTVPSHSVIALLVWPQWWTKVQSIPRKFLWFSSIFGRGPHVQLFKFIFLNHPTGHSPWLTVDT